MAICLLMAAAAGAYLVFLVFCIVTAKMNIADVDGDATLYFIGRSHEHWSRWSRVPPLLALAGNATTATVSQRWRRNG